MAIDLSVIIVNYNVKALLEQTLLSVFKAKQDLSIEVIVVDNCSADQSADMIKAKFKTVILIENQENLGFSKANNQGIKMAQGRHVLLLNPDTVVSEDSFSKTVHFLDQTPNAGALGVRMIDGRGEFLPESKRGLPTPAVAFYKMSGLAKLFPKSKVFGAYHLSYLSEFETNKVDILSGAFMMIKRSVLEQTGYLDEQFFMYGEDIDLSYRIVKAGYDNYYFADTTIIHYKGESTKKHSVNYVKIFYLAMAKFADKHFSKQQGWWFGACIRLAIFVRALLALCFRIFNSSKLFVLDFATIFIGYYGIMRYWEHYNKFVVGGFYPLAYVQWHIPAYILLWLGGVYISGAYKSPFQLNKCIRGVVLGSLMLLSIYALLPEDLRFSRALILLGSVWALLITCFNRLLLHVIKYKHFDTNSSQRSQVIIVGDHPEYLRVRDILLQYPNRFKLLGYVQSKSQSDAESLGQLQHLSTLIEIYKANEIIFCAKDVSSQDIMQIMGQAHNSDIKYKIMPEQGAHIIGSNSKNTTGEFYSVDISPALNNPLIKRKKRLFDIGFSFVLPLISICVLFNAKFTLKYWENWWTCLIGKTTWVGYIPKPDKHQLPLIKPAVFNIGQAIKHPLNDEQLMNNMNMVYASNYHWQSDLNCLLNIIINSNKQ